MHRLVLDLLSLARLEAGTADLQREPVHLPALLHAVLERFTPQARQAQVALSVQAPQEAPAIIGDGDRLAQVFNNLVENAIKFTSAGGQVLLALRVEPGALLVSVQDSGKGISADDQARIFERFYQVDKSRARENGRRGSGLGLAIVRELVEAHQGTIRAHSQVGQGTAFLVRLPVCREPVAATA